jgi:hypothetical protein
MAAILLLSFQRKGYKGVCHEIQDRLPAHNLPPLLARASRRNFRTRLLHSLAPIVDDKLYAGLLDRPEIICVARYDLSAQTHRYSRDKTGRQLKRRSLPGCFRPDRGRRQAVDCAGQDFTVLPGTTATTFADAPMRPSLQGRKQFPIPTHW